MQKPAATTTTKGELPHEEDPAADKNFVHDASTQVPPQMHTNMNGMPPQQVYVENIAPTNVAGLETQFQTLGIQGEDGATEGNPEGDVEHGEGNDEGGEGEDDPLKLFVGQVSFGFPSISRFRISANATPLCGNIIATASSSPQFFMLVHGLTFHA